MRPGTLLAKWALLAGLLCAPVYAQASVLRGTPAQVLSAIRPEVQRGVIFLGIPGDEALWAQLRGYLEEGRANVFTPVCPQNRPKNAQLYRLSAPGNGILIVLQQRSNAVWLTGDTRRLEGALLPASAYPQLIAQFNLDVLATNPERVFPRCP